MVTIKNKNSIIVCLLVFFCSCNILWDRGQIVDGHFVPRRPNFKFKDKANHIVPLHLDTTDTYLAISSSTNSREYPISDYFFLKFYPYGRILDAQIFDSDSLVLQKTYKEALEERNIYIYTNEGYYYSKDGKQIQLEFFTHMYDWPKIGGYQIDNYYLSQTGDTLTRQNPKSNFKMIYVKVKTPRVLEDYPVDW